MRVFTLLLIIFLFLFACVSPPQVIKARYDEQRELYVAVSGPGRGAVLRDEKRNIIREESEKDRFLKKYGTSNAGIRPTELEFEKNGLFIRNNYEISFLYFSGVRELNKGNYDRSLYYLGKAVDKYPDIIFYSDISFLAGYCYEKQGELEKAEKYYTLFMEKAEQKYSVRFLETDRLSSHIYKEELEYVRHFKETGYAEFSESFTKNETVKYFNNYHYPGFSVGLHTGISSIGFSVIPDFEKIEDSFCYIGTGYTINRWFDIGGGIGFPSPFTSDISADFQLLRTKNRRFGISLEAGLFYSLRDTIVVNNETINLDPSLHFINAGLKLGTGFYILPDLFLGGYYQYYIFNEYNKFPFKANGQDFITWSNNSYRITLRYLILDNLDLDFSFRNNELYFGTHMYYYSYDLFFGYGILENRLVIQLNSVNMI